MQQFKSSLNRKTELMQQNRESIEKKNRINATYIESPQKRTNATK